MRIGLSTPGRSPFAVIASRSAVSDSPGAGSFSETYVNLWGFTS